MRNKVLVFQVENYSDRDIKNTINKELDSGWLIQSFYNECKKLIVVLFRKELSFKENEDDGK